MTSTIQMTTIDVLTACVTGKENRGNELQLQKLFPAASILHEFHKIEKQLHNSADQQKLVLWLRRRTKLMLFFLHLYIDAEAKDRGLEHAVDMWSVLASFEVAIKETAA